MLANIIRDLKLDRLVTLEISSSTQIPVGIAHWIEGSCVAGEGYPLSPRARVFSSERLVAQVITSRQGVRFPLDNKTNSISQSDRPLSVLLYEPYRHVSKKSTG
ncbi:hypothetical protein ACLOJK_030524 [Asimina triloba]